MSKASLVEAVYKQHELATKTGKPLAKAAVSRLIDSVFDHAGKQIVAHGSFRYPGFGSFSIRERKARTAFKALPKKKGETVDRSEANKLQIPARSVVGFRPSQDLKVAVKDLKRVKRTSRSAQAKEQEIA